MEVEVLLSHERSWRLTCVIFLRSYGAGTYTLLVCCDCRYDSNAAVEVASELRKRGDMYARVLGNVVYVMVSPTTRPEACRNIMSSLEDILQGLLQGKEDLMHGDEFA